MSVRIRLEFIFFRKSPWMCACDEFPESCSTWDFDFVCQCFFCATRVRDMRANTLRDPIFIRDQNKNDSFRQSVCNCIGAQRNVRSILVLRRSPFWFIRCFLLLTFCFHLCFAFTFPDTTSVLDMAVNMHSPSAHTNKIQLKNSLCCRRCWRLIALQQSEAKMNKKHVIKSSDSSWTRSIGMYYSFPCLYNQHPRKWIRRVWVARSRLVQRYKAMNKN